MSTLLQQYNINIETKKINIYKHIVQESDQSNMHTIVL